MTNNRTPALAGLRAVIDRLDAAVIDAQRSWPMRYPVPPDVDALIEYRDFAVERARNGALRSTAVVQPQ